MTTQGVAFFNARDQLPMWDGAACVGTDVNAWFPDSEEDNQREVAILSEMCVGCPIQAKCLQWALGHEAYGVWGGLTAMERWSLGGLRPVNVRDTRDQIRTQLLRRWVMVGGNLARLQSVVNEWKLRDRL